MSQAEIPAEIRGDLVSLLRRVNTAAHSAGSREHEQVLYRLKDDLISAALVCMDSENVDLSYQRDNRGRVSVVVSLHSHRSRTFHTFFERLSPSAKTRVWNALGGPGQ